MRKSTSIHIEEDLLNEIDEYRKKHTLSSRSAALERMLLERRFLLTYCNTSSTSNIQVSTTEVDIVTDNKEIEDTEKSTIIPEIGNALSSIFNNMPEGND